MSKNREISQLADVDIAAQLDLDTKAEIDDNQTTVSSTWSSNRVNTELSTKQDTLVSGTNIKTIAGNSVLGSGDIPQSVFGGQADFQEFTTSGTWTKPDGVTFIYVECVGGGESGGAANSVYNTQKSPAGGLPGQVIKKMLNANDVSSTVSVIVGAGGSSRVSTGYLNLQQPAPGGDSSFGSFVSAKGGNIGGVIITPSELYITVSRDSTTGSQASSPSALYGNTLLFGHKVNAPASGAYKGTQSSASSGYTSVMYGDGGASDALNGVDGGFPGGGGGAAAGYDSSPYGTVRTSGKGGDGVVRVWAW